MKLPSISVVILWLCGGPREVRIQISTYQGALTVAECLAFDLYNCSRGHIVSHLFNNWSSYEKRSNAISKGYMPPVHGHILWRMILTKQNVLRSADADGSLSTPHTRPWLSDIFDVGNGTEGMCVMVMSNAVTGLILVYCYSCRLFTTIQVAPNHCSLKWTWNTPLMLLRLLAVSKPFRWLFLYPMQRPPESDKSQLLLVHI